MSFSSSTELFDVLNGLAFNFKINRMNLSDFILLSLEQKQVVVLHEGVLIAKRTNKDCLIFLFQMHSFYVEMFCNIESRDVEEIRIFDNTRHLSPYLEAIPIDDLLK